MHFYYKWRNWIVFVCTHKHPTNLYANKLGCTKIDQSQNSLHSLVFEFTWLQHQQETKLFALFIQVHLPATTDQILALWWYQTLTWRGCTNTQNSCILYTVHSNYSQLACLGLHQQTKPWWQVLLRYSYLLDCNKETNFVLTGIQIHLAVPRP